MKGKINSVVENPHIFLALARDESIFQLFSLLPGWDPCLHLAGGLMSAGFQLTVMVNVDFL